VRWPGGLDGEGWRIVDRVRREGHEIVYARYDAWWGTRWGIWADGRLAGLAAWFWRDALLEVGGKAYRIRFRRRLAPFRRRFVVEPTVADPANPRWLRRLRTTGGGRTG
jgi:hypothetical protein